MVRVNPAGLEKDPEFFLGDPERTFPRNRCVAVFREMYIYPNGDVPACFHMPELKVGNVRRDGGVGAVWNSEAWRAFRPRVNRGGWLPICGRCER